jgi:hypothetical protein
LPFAQVDLKPRIVSFYLVHSFTLQALGLASIGYLCAEGDFRRRLNVRLAICRRDGSSAEHRGKNCNPTDEL